MKLARNDTDPTVVLSYPPDPRQLPKDVFEHAYGAGEDLVPAELASHKPGKWLRKSSKDLSALSPVLPMPPQWMQLMQGFHQMSAMAAQMNGDLDNLVVFPNKKRPRNNALGAGQGTQLALQDAVRNQQADAPPLGDQCNADGSPGHDAPHGPAPFQLPCDEPGTKEALADQEVDAHLQSMGSAFDARKATKQPVLKKPSASTSASAKGKAKAKAKPSTGSAAPDAGAPKGKGRGKGKGEVHHKRPPMMQPGGATVYYLQGKIHRSEASQCFRVFRHYQDRCDHKVNFKGNPKAAWARALSKIEDHASGK